MPTRPDTSVLILAAGQGTRMRSALPKVLQPLAGQPLLAHVLSTSHELAARNVIVVHGHGAAEVKARFAGESVDWVLQAEQLGTGHAVAQAMPRVPDEHMVLVLYGDVPLITAATLERLLQTADENTVALLTVRLPDPAGYGRILRDPSGNIQRIVEHKDATDSERRVDEVNTGLLAAPAGRLRAWLDAVGNDNAQGEYYLTDIIAMAVEENVAVRGVEAEQAEEVHGINDKLQLADAERYLRRRNARALMREGVTLIDPDRFDLRGKLSCGKDVLIDVNVVMEGDVRLGDGVIIGPGCVIRNSEIGSGTHVEANSHIESANVGKECRIGPFARLRPEAVLRNHVHIGNFVEVKKADIAEGSKANHLTYIGDATIGKGVNVGAGTITCNYDGANKHRTIIEDGAFIGSNTSLVAPIRIGANATVGAGSTLSKDAPADTLSVSRARQTSIPGWKRPKKK